MIKALAARTDTLGFEHPVRHAIGRRLITFFIVFIGSGLAVPAQLPTGSIAGSVSDPSKAVVPNVQVTLQSQRTGATRTTTTSTTGYYEFLQLPPQVYTVTAEAPGFQRVVQRDIEVNAGQVVRIDLTLAVGDVQQTLEVTAAAPLIEPDKPSISYVISSTNIMSLPLQGRQFLDLALLTPGALPTAPGTQVSAFSIAGMRGQSNNYTLDGISNNDPQVNGPLNGFRITDAVQEFNVQTSIASTEVGRNSGAQISIITKSGGNDFHGSLFYYHRNEALDATPFFLNRAGSSKNVLRRHQFGGTVGGPIRRDKTFWFLSFESYRQKTAQPVTARVPTPEERNSVTDPVSQRLLQFWPLPNTFGASNTNWTGTTSNSDNNETYFLRIDHDLSANNRLTGRYALFEGRSLTLQTDPFNGSITNRPNQHSFLLQDTYTRARTVNEFRLGYSRNRTFFRPADVGINPAGIFTDAAGSPLPGFVDTQRDPLDGGLPRITIVGFAGLGAGTNMPQGRATNTYELIENLALTEPWGLDRHTFRFGVEARREIANRFLNGNYRGAISFGSWDNFARGEARTGSLRTGEGGTFRTWFRTAFYTYAQDTYKILPNLTLNLGLRWEFPGRSYEKYDRGSNFVPGVGMMALNSDRRVSVDRNALGRAALSLTPVGTTLPRSGQYHNEVRNFAPFLGVTYSPRFWTGLFGENKTVIRTGFRLSYDDVFHNIPVNMGLNFPPVLATTLPQATGTPQNPFYSWGSVLNQNRPLFNILTFNAWDVEAPTSYGMNYALEIERQFGRNYAVEVSYIGSQGRKLGVYLDANQPFVIVNDPTVIGAAAPNQQIFPYPEYRAIAVGSFVSNSSYNGMVVALRKRMSHGFSVNASYTLGKSLDDNSSFFGSDRDTGSYADVRNRKLDRGRSDFDVRHRFVASYLAELPFGPGRLWLNSAPGWVNQIVGGWELSGIITYRSGFPFTVFAGTSTDYSGLNQLADRPNWAPGVTSLPTNFKDPDNAFPCHTGPGNCGIFTPPAAGQVGNVGRNRFTGPRAFNWDFALRKSFRLAEARRVQIGAELFNVLNHTNFNLPSSTINFGVSSGRPNNTASGRVGTITGAADPRLIQVSARLDW